MVNEDSYMLNLDTHSDAIKKICKKYGVKHLEAFGSSLRSDFNASQSDVDLFYEFDSRENLFLRFMGLKRELEELLNRKVDLIKEAQIQNPFFKKEIDQSPRKTLYAA